MGATLFADESMLGEAGEEFGPDGGLGPPVGLADEIVLGLLRDQSRIELPEAAQQHPATGLRGRHTSLTLRVEHAHLPGKWAEALA